MEEQFILLFLIITILLCVMYVLLIGSYCYGWIKTITPNIVDVKDTVFISVIVAARNEESVIDACILAIIEQNYSNQLFELIIVDDASTDGTINKVSKFCKNYSNIQLITLSDLQGGKKNAITSAVAIAKGELIVTTDADCVMGTNWLRTIASFYRQSNAKMIVAPVVFYNEKTVFEKMQSLEFMALIASSCGSLYFNKATMCNGANLIYTKNVFNEVNGFEGINKIASGDDVLLMYKIKERYPKQLFFLKHTDAIVYTKAKVGFNEFVGQRMRWASKGFNILNKETKYAAFTVYLFNLLLFLLLIIAFFYSPNFKLHLPFYKVCLIIVGFKVLIDFLLLFLTSSFFKKKTFLLYFLQEQLLYTVYVVLIGWLGSKKKYKWKGRNIY